MSYFFNKDILDAPVRRYSSITLRLNDSEYARFSCLTLPSIFVYLLCKLILGQDTPSVTVILMTAYGDIELAVRALKEGAADFVLKPWQNDKLVAILKTACQSKSRDGNRSAEAAEFIRKQPG